jgi:hypothetical protein
VAIASSPISNKRIKQARRICEEALADLTLSRARAEDEKALDCKSLLNNALFLESGFLAVHSERTRRHRGPRLGI